MTQWFGKPWNRHCCTPDARVELPKGKKCSQCDELLLQGDQGLALPHASTDPTECGLRYQHLDCVLKRILPHDGTCLHCRGKDKSEHASLCAYRQSGGNCNCMRLEDL